MNQLLVRAASNLSLVNISKGRSNRGGVGFIVTRKQNGLSGIGMAVSTGILEESASYTDTNGYQSGEAIYRTLVPTVSARSMATLSSPSGRRGTFYLLFQSATLREKGELAHPLSSVPICFSRDCRTNPIT